MIHALPTLGLIAFGFWEAFLVFMVILLMFGAKRIPQIAKGLGAGIRNFKGELKEPVDGDPPRLED